MFFLSAPLDPSLPAWKSSATVRPVQFLYRTMSIMWMGSVTCVVVICLVGYTIDRTTAATKVRQVRPKPTPVVISNATRHDSTHLGVRGAGCDFCGSLVDKEYAKDTMNVTSVMIMNNASVIVLFCWC